MLHIVANIHALYTPAGREALGPVVAALELAPQERALYLRRGPVGKAAAKVGGLLRRSRGHGLRPGVSLSVYCQCASLQCTKLNSGCI